MEKVLVISYFFPPCNLTASQRAQSWANYLAKFNYKPIVITRRWDHKISHLSDVSKPTPTEIVHEVNDNYEVYYLPYFPNLRDKLYVQHRESKYNTLRRLLTLGELSLQPFINNVIPYHNIGDFAMDYARKNPDIKKMIISGNPFNLFKFGYQIHSISGLKWIADYRDAWTTSEIEHTTKSLIYRLIARLDAHFEKKWVGSASLVTASSKPIADSITAFTGTPSHALYNGFVSSDFDVVKNTAKYEDFTVTYVGTLYDGQKVEIFCNAFIQLIKQTPGIKAKLLFPGIAFYKEQHERIKRAMKGYEAYYECTERMDRSKILEIEKRSHLLLHVAWDEQQGIIASKIYEYIASGTYIVVTPTDKGAIEEIVQKSGCGICTSTTQDTLDFLTKEYTNYLAGKTRTNDINNENVMQFSREKQAGRLAELLDKL